MCTSGIWDGTMPTYEQANSSLCIQQRKKIDSLFGGLLGDADAYSLSLQPSV